MEKSKFRKKVLSVVLSLPLAVSAMAGGMYAQDVYASEEVILHNPEADMDAMCAGQKVTWDCVYFGSYPQTEVSITDSEYAALQNAQSWDANGDAVVNGVKYRRVRREDGITYHYFRYEPVKWRVMETDGKKAMLLSDMALDDREYNAENEGTTWETSTIRSWLNGYGADVNREGINYSSSNFIDSAFTAEEKASILDTDVINNDNLWWRPEGGGNDTNDKLFLLSESEVNTDAASVFGFVQDGKTYDEARRCEGSDYAKAMGLYSNQYGNCNWWLRSQGCYGNSAVHVNYNGYVDGGGHYVDFTGNGVRVVLNLNLTPSNPYTYAGTVCSDGAVDEGIEQYGIISNPKIVKVTNAQHGQNVKYDCVYFGSYPQTEVKNTDSEYAVLQSAEGWDENGDAVINSTKYRRMLKGDATHAQGGSNYYYWGDDTTYHYFKYEPVKWRVLKTDGNSALLLSDVVIDDREYNTENEGITWETSTIRSWLNGYGADTNNAGTDYSSSNFIDSAFTAEEKASISDTNVINNDNLEYGTEGGNDTNDKLFLLSESEVYTEEAKTYGFSPYGFVGDKSRKCKGSDYAKAMGAYTSEGSCRWWLRSPGNGSNYAAFVYGGVSSYGDEISYNDPDLYIKSDGIRVALNLNLSYSDNYTYVGTVYSGGTADSPEEPLAKRPQAIKVTKSYKKSYGSKPFKLNVKLTEGNGTLSYTTSDKKTAAVDKNGKVTIKGTGICTITVTASATGTYKSTSENITISVKPKKNTVTKLKASGGRMLEVKWKKDTKGTGYELQYSVNKNFPKKTSKTVRINKNKTASYKIKKLAKGKKYYIRVRTYKKVKENGNFKMLYGDWSKSKRSGFIR